MYNPLEELHPYEKWAINALVTVFALIFAGLSLHFLGISNPLSEICFFEATIAVNNLKLSKLLILKFDQQTKV